MTNKERQEKFDEQKWFDSIEVNQDTCGTYKQCDFCDKSVDFPCAVAYKKRKKKKKTKREV